MAVVVVCSHDRLLELFQQHKAKLTGSRTASCCCCTIGMEKRHYRDRIRNFPRGWIRKFSSRYGQDGQRLGGGPDPPLTAVQTPKSRTNKPEHVSRSSCSITRRLFIAHSDEFDTISSASNCNWSDRDPDNLNRKTSRWFNVFCWISPSEGINTATSVNGVGSQKGTIFSLVRFWSDNVAFNFLRQKFSVFLTISRKNMPKTSSTSNRLQFD